MATYKKITDVDVVEKNDQMNVLVDDSGALKKVPVGEMGGGNGGGGGGVPVAIIKQVGLEAMAAGVAPAAAVDPEFACENMTFAEAWSILISAKPLAATITYWGSVGSDEGIMTSLIPFVMGAMYNGVECVVLYMTTDNPLFWTADGILLAPPGEN